jgi:hypothetical protein
VQLQLESAGGRRDGAGRAGPQEPPSVHLSKIWCHGAFRSQSGWETQCLRLFGTAVRRYADPMLFRGQIGGRSACVSFKDTSVSLSIGTGWVAAWDAGGRLYTLWRGGHTYRRGLNGRMLLARGGGFQDAGLPVERRGRVALGDHEADALLDEAAGRAGDARAALAAWGDETRRPPGEAVLAVLRRASCFDARSAREDARRFARVYRPIGILPPDQYLSVVVQATEGCSFGSCTFCNLYHDAYRVKTPQEFRTHLREVRAYLGDSIGLRRRSIFLGAANALAVRMGRLVDLFGMLSPGLDIPAPRVCAFVDGFTGARKTGADYARLRELGLWRVYVGLESGDDDLLAFVRKPATSEETVGTVRAIKHAGVSVGVIVLIGLGGGRFAAAHAERTAAAISAMGLDAGDLVFFSDLVESPETVYPHAAAREGVRPLAREARLGQVETIRSHSAFPGPPPRFARYDVRAFVY